MRKFPWGHCIAAITRSGQRAHVTRTHVNADRDYDGGRILGSHTRMRFEARRIQHRTGFSVGDRAFAERTTHDVDLPEGAAGTTDASTDNPSKLGGLD